MKVNDRFIWAVEMLHIDPDDHILEIGCGHGIAVSLIAPQLKTGSITAVDSSRAMIDKAQRKTKALKPTSSISPFVRPCWTSGTTRSSPSTSTSS